MKHIEHSINILGGFLFCLLLFASCKDEHIVMRNSEPIATSVLLELELNQATGHYIYADKEKDPEGESLYQWYRADDRNGLNEVKIQDATSKIYRYKKEDDGKYLAFEVTPIQNDNKKGRAVKSSYVGKVVWSNESEEEEIAKDIQLKFLDEYIFPANQMFNGTVIGGLSGIDYDSNTYYVVSDDYKNPRYYKANIEISNNEIIGVDFTEVAFFDKGQEYYSSHFLDLESIIFQNGNVVVSSEGSINYNRRPCVFYATAEGTFISEYKIPNHFLSQSRHNGVFESLSKSVDQHGFWCDNELPLISDKPETEYLATKSPLRFTYYANESKEATKEFVYELSPLPLPKSSSGDINGVSDILEYKENQFLVIERAFQGRNVVRIYKASITEESTNTLHIPSLQSSDYIPMKKELLFDFEDVKSSLANHQIDNIEGITFGETLPNGHKTIIVISDDNFQRFGKQLNQFILLELIENE